MHEFNEEEIRNLRTYLFGGNTLVSQILVMWCLSQREIFIIENKFIVRDFLLTPNQAERRFSGLLNCVFKSRKYAIKSPI
jgi:hypothetical protein